MDTQPYLLSLSLKRLEIVGDILQLFLQLGTFTVGFCKKRGEKKAKRKWEGKTGETRSESMCREEQEVLKEMGCDQAGWEPALRHLCRKQVPFPPPSLY